MLCTTFQTEKVRMRSLSELVKREYDVEVQVIKEAGGSLCPKLVGLTIGVAGMWGASLLFGDSWTKRDIGFGIIIQAVPVLFRCAISSSGSGDGIFLHILGRFLPRHHLRIHGR
jgi:hypothetical protein